MPTISHTVLPKPESWSEFEDIVLSSFKIKWNSTDLQRHGRQGQIQNGIDIYGSDDLGRLVGIQCKCVNELNEKDIINEIKKAEAFNPPLNALYFAVGFSRDSKLQAIIRLKSEERIKIKKFPIGIYFWEDIIFEICKNEEELGRHYPQFKFNLKYSHIRTGSKLLAILDIGFFSQNLNYYMDLLFGEMGQLANEDPLQLQQICLIIKQVSLRLFNQSESNIIANKINELLTYVLPWVMNQHNRPQGWKPVNILVKEIENLTAQVQYFLRKRELAIYSLSLKLGSWEKFTSEVDKPYPRKKQIKILQLSKKCFANRQLQREIKRKLKEYRIKESIYTLRIPSEIYTLIRDAIMFSGL